MYLDDAVVRYEEHEEIVRGQKEDKFTEFMSRINSGGIVEKPKFVEGLDPAKAMLQEAESYHADLILVSTRGYREAATVLPGIKTSKVMTETNMPVHAVKHISKAMSLWESMLSGKFWKRIQAKNNKPRHSSWRD